MDPDARERARVILDEELERILAFQDAADERAFIEDLNNSIIYSEQREFAYNNNPEPAKKCRITQTLKYHRSKKVSSNALLKAGFLCEVNTEHLVFVRKIAMKIIQSRIIWFHCLLRKIFLMRI